jgi:hypothetical protein
MTIGRGLIPLPRLTSSLVTAGLLASPVSLFSPPTFPTVPLDPTSFMAISGPFRFEHSTICSGERRFRPFAALTLNVLLW